MKFLFVWMLLAGCLQTLQAQSFSLSDMEICPEVVTYGAVPTSYRGIPDSKEARYFSGGIIRYNINRFAIRAGFNYTTNTTSGSEVYNADTVNGNAGNKELKIKLGGQYNL